jgi:hypothetical protein
MADPVESSLERPIADLYDMISGPADHERPWDKITELFLPDARLRLEIENEDGSISSADWSVDEFAHDAAEHYRKAGFWEREIARRTERFGNIAQVFSTYETRIGDPGNDPVVRGINGFQMLRRGGRWLIAGIVFHKEQPGAPIPERYLKSASEKRG